MACRRGGSGGVGSVEDKQVQGPVFFDDILLFYVASDDSERENERGEGGRERGRGRGWTLCLRLFVSR